MVPIIPEPAISIHAPSRERRTTFISTFYKLQFRSTLPRGSDLQRFTGQITIRYKNFNPRSLAGATHRHVSHRQIQSYFNPRSLAGATFKLGFVTINGAISIHAPSRERPRPIVFHGKPSSISIHAPSRERPFLVSTVIPFIQISIHAPSRERQAELMNPPFTQPFQSTLPRGSDCVLT